MYPNLWLWFLTSVGLAALFIFSFVTHIRRPHVPSFRQAAQWTGFFVCCAIIFGLLLVSLGEKTAAMAFYAGYITEYSLSIDNLFVFSLIMARFAVPSDFQQKVLLTGIFIALVLRTIFILIGAAALARYSWLFYILGAFLIFTAVQLLFEPDEDDYQPNIVIRWVQSRLRFSSEYHDSRLTTKINGQRYFTPMMMVMIAIGLTDILFALDSIPAIYGLTDSAYIVFTANAFALLGMVELYFLIDGLLKRLVYLNYGLAVILAFIGIKLVIDALNGNSLGFINHGEPITLIPEIGTLASLIFIVVTLTITALASLYKSRKTA